MAVVTAGYAGSRAYAREAQGIERVALKKLLWVGPLGVALAAVAMMTVLFTVAAVAVFAAIAKLSIQPIRTYQIVAVVSLALSVFPDLMLLNEPETTGGDVVALIILHVVAAVAVSVPLCTYARKA